MTEPLPKWEKERKAKARAKRKRKAKSRLQLLAEGRLKPDVPILHLSTRSSVAPPETAPSPGGLERSLALR